MRRVINCVIKRRQFYLFVCYISIEIVRALADFFSYQFDTPTINVIRRHRTLNGVNLCIYKRIYFCVCNMKYVCCARSTWTRTKYEYRFVIFSTFLCRYSVYTQVYNTLHAICSFNIIHCVKIYTLWAR